MKRLPLQLESQSDILSQNKMEQEAIQQAAQGFIGKYGWLLLAGATTIIFKDIVSQFAAGLTIWFSKE